MGSKNGKSVFAEKCVLFFFLLALVVLPIIYHDYYFHILETKYAAYCTFAIGITAVVGIYTLITAKSLKIEKKCKMPVPDICILVFWGISLISTICSPYKYEALWGNEGRYTGLFLITLYTIAYFLIVRFLQFKDWILDAFLLAGLAVCLMGILQYFKIDVLHFKAYMKEEQIEMFTSFIGNINTYTAYVGMLIAASAVLFVSVESKLKTLGYFISMIIGFFAIIMGTSDNAYLSLGMLFGFLPLWAFRSRRGIKRYVVMIASFFGVIQCIDWLNSMFADSVLGINSAFRLIIQYEHLGILVFLLVLAAVLLYAWDWMKKPKKEDLGPLPRRAWCVLLAAAALVVFGVFIDANFLGNAERYSAVKDYVVFSDAWGNYRGLVWRLSAEEYGKFPLVQKIFGYGPETFGIRLYLERSMDMTQIAGQIYDSAHNEYIQYFFTVGPFGCLAYIMLIISSIAGMFKYASSRPYVMAIAYAILGYSVQAAVNLSQPISTPIFLTLLSVGVAAYRRGIYTANHKEV